MDFSPGVVAWTSLMNVAACQRLTARRTACAPSGRYHSQEQSVQPNCPHFQHNQNLNTRTELNIAGAQKVGTASVREL
jgi:hypothetical protein